MSTTPTLPPPELNGNGAPPAAEPPTTAVEFHYSQSDSFVALLSQLNASLLVTTYQANKLLVVRAAGGGLSTLVRTFDQPMGMALSGRRLALGTRNQIWFLRDAPDIAPRIEPAGMHDACYLPRSCHVTGDIRCHEIAWAGDELWIVNTRFSCLSTLDPDYSFVPRWRPPFVTALAAEDRCHLNGLAMENDRPRYVTALGNTDTQGGWRANKAKGGCLIDVPSGEIVVRVATSSARLTFTRRLRKSLTCSSCRACASLKSLVFKKRRSTTRSSSLDNNATAQNGNYIRDDDQAVDGMARLPCRQVVSRGGFPGFWDERPLTCIYRF